MIFDNYRGVVRAPGRSQRTLRPRLKRGRDDKHDQQQESSSLPPSRKEPGRPRNFRAQYLLRVSRSDHNGNHFHPCRGEDA